jgi:hypothetical protein
MSRLGSRATGKEKIIGLQLCCTDPSLQGFLGLVCDFELHRTVRLLLH